MSIADVLAAFLAFGLLHLRGLHNYSGWRWLFLIEVSFHVWKMSLDTLLTVTGASNSRSWSHLICSHASQSNADRKQTARKEGMVH